MPRLIQIIRNSFIRLEGLLYQLFGFFSKILGWLNQIFNFLSKLFGFTSSQYFLETDDAPQGIKQAKAETDMPASVTVDSPPAASATRRRPDTSMDYFLKMARREKSSS